MLKVLIFLFPWSLRRRLLDRWFRYEIHPDVYTRVAWVFPQKLRMVAEVKIDHFTVAIHLDSTEMGRRATIGRSNWSTGFPTKVKSSLFQHQPDRCAELYIGEATSITKNHHPDCTNQIRIGRFATVTGCNSRFLTHSINVGKTCRTVYQSK